MAAVSEPAPNPIREQTEEFLNSQCLRGFKPMWMISYHYGNPDERGWNIGRRTTNTGHARANHQPLMLNQQVNDGITRARNDFFFISKDAKHIRNLLRQSLWGIKRHDVHDESETPMIFFHEKGNEGTQFHTHILLGQTTEPFVTHEAIEGAWNQQIKPKAKCLSATNSIHVRFVDSRDRAFGYLSKELRFRSDVIDYEASCLFRQASSIELALGHNLLPRQQSPANLEEDSWMEFI